jgi:NADH dehydrogenase FAD-containing subunit
MKRVVVVGSGEGGAAAARKLQGDTVPVFLWKGTRQTK